MPLAMVFHACASPPHPQHTSSTTASELRPPEPVSVKGTDDELLANLQSFARLDHANYELRA